MDYLGCTKAPLGARIGSRRVSHKARQILLSVFLGLGPQCCLRYLTASSHLESMMTPSKEDLASNRRCKIKESEFSSSPDPNTLRNLGQLILLLSHSLSFLIYKMKRINQQTSRLFAFLVVRDNSNTFTHTVCWILDLQQGLLRQMAVICFLGAYGWVGQMHCS